MVQVIRGPARRAPRLRAWGSGPVTSRALRLVVAVLALLACQLAVAGQASAHDYLVSTSPATGGLADTSPQQVSLTFNEAVNRRFSTVRVTGPQGGVWQSGAPSVLGATVTQRLLPLGPAGPYQVTWRVVSADGHPIGGSFAFTLRTAGTGTPAATGAGAPADTSGASSGSSWVPLAAALVVVALLLAAAAAALSRRRASAAIGTPDAASPARPRRG